MRFDGLVLSLIVDGAEMSGLENNGAHNGAAGHEGTGRGASNHQARVCRSNVGTITAVTAILGMMLTSCSDGSSQNDNADGQTRRIDVGTVQANVQPCRRPDKTERDASSTDDVVVRGAPSSDAPPIRKPDTDPKPSDVKALATVTNDVSLRASCTESGWTRIRVLDSSLRWMIGWVPAAALQRLKLDANGRRTLTGADIEWQPGSERDRTAIVKVANLILRNDQRCEAIDARSLLVDGLPGAREYGILCSGPLGDQMIRFKARDAASRDFTAKVMSDPGDDDALVAIDKLDAGKACIAAVTEQLAQPDSADFHTFSDTTFNTDGSRARFTVGLTVKNGLGLEVEQMAACTFNGSNLETAEVLPPHS
jgi:hypothetical protein